MQSLKCLILLILASVCVSFSAELTANEYHNKIGIKRANLIRYNEALTRIVGGTPSSLTSYPYTAGIVVRLTTGWTSICGGALISNTRVLTAAHCWFDGSTQATLFTIVLGSLTIFSGGTRIESKDVVTHPSWNTNDIMNDIAMVKISAVTFNNNIQSVPLPDLTDVNQDFSGMTAYASGYGKTSDAQTSFPTSTSLYHTSLNVMKNTDCQKSFEISIHGSHLCTSGENGVGTCEGDSGGPLTLVWKNQRTLVGIVSFGLGDGCQRGFPSVFTRVTSFLNWIHSNI